MVVTVVEAAFLTCSCRRLQGFSDITALGGFAIAVRSVLYYTSYEKDAMSSASATSWPSTEAVAPITMIDRFSFKSCRLKIS